MQDWFSEGDKFAILGVNVALHDGLERSGLPGGLVAVPNDAFELPSHWIEWLGSHQVKGIKECNLYVLANMRSATPNILDAESQILQRRVGHWYHGLLLSKKLREYSEPFILSGGKLERAVDVRSFSILIPSASTIVLDDSEITIDALKRAAKIAEQLETFQGPWQSHHWRFSRCLAIYLEARTKNDILDRIHQFTRCIEGLILPEQGNTKKQFKSRTELFVGPRHHDLMGEVYDVRSDIEHLHEYKHLVTFNREKRIRLAGLEAKTEWIARSCLERIVLDPQLLKHFGSVSSLQAFWAKPGDERRVIWGEPIDPYTCLAGFNSAHVDDAQLGAR
ncbi:hypothetical protein RWA02_07625 [Sinorhizobium meliloti]|uniref:hypothetical protein n=1 Tax=Rhizobium meliloti TaxID=382 RepID=UPI000FD8F995|nr:hypothetical protein [Sinorhizobium meliloti]MDW9527391.1 hypothetical protein [Sinorhizobium meliloti]MDW9622914.1 hypothetical protein [Sinorhizobium meliloti]MDW9881267.1 hypothetical protein [Sinorhizobium meliloti]MDW9993627.1 hypothetical protein [Sinorhizobium meliloti]RVG01722.1 hypothetical protein CN232_09365 [Sinorhizobium meliloti]